MECCIQVNGRNCKGPNPRLYRGNVYCSRHYPLRSKLKKTKKRKSTYVKKVKLNPGLVKKMLNKDLVQENLDLKDDLATALDIITQMYKGKLPPEWNKIREFLEKHKRI